MKKYLLILLSIVGIIIITFVGSVFGVFDEFFDSSINGDALYKQMQIEYTKLQKESPNIAWNVIEYIDFPSYCTNDRKQWCDFNTGNFVRIKMRGQIISEWEMKNGNVLVAAESHVKKSIKTFRLFTFNKYNNTWVLLNITKIVMIYDSNLKIYVCQ